jgi:hypothetical protein
MTARPTPQFRDHHDVEEPRVDDRAFRQGWRVRTRLDQLLADARIKPDEWQTASEYRQTWAIARELAGPEPGMIRITGAASADAATIARLDAATTLRLVEEAIGPFAARLLLASVVHDLAWAVLARHLGKHPETVRDWTVLAIRALAPAWASVRGLADARPPHDSRPRVERLGPRPGARKGHVPNRRAV